MNKKILTIAEIIFALVFVILMAMIFRNVIGFGNDANSTISGMREAIADADIASYDDTIVSGDTVISTVNKLKETKNGLKLSYAVCVDDNTSSSSSWYTYGSGVLQFSGSSGTIHNGGNVTIDNIAAGTAFDSYKTYKLSLRPGEDGYISPVQEYKSQLAFNNNNVLIGIVFVKQ